MKLLLQIGGAVALVASLSGCSLGGLLGGGKPPVTLVTLTPEAAEPASIARTAAAGARHEEDPAGVVRGVDVAAIRRGVHGCWLGTHGQELYGR